MSYAPMAITERGHGPPLVLLHAFPLSSALFDAFGELPGYRLMAPDLRGFGATPLGDDDPSLARMADDVVALLDRQNLSRAVVGGVSMGGYVVMELLRRAPERLAGALLVDTKAEADTEEAAAGRHAMAEAVLAEGRPVLDPMLGALLGATTRASRPDVVDRVAGWLDQAPPNSVAWAQRAMAARPDSLSTLSTTRVPVGVVVGSEDTLSPPEAAQRMADAAGTAVHLVPGAGHLAVTERPTAARRAVLAALEDVRP
jgi:pimeloyl-ACP methyl ester carboxylesterase